MLARLMTASIIGIDALPIDVEVDITQGLPAITIVGLPDASVQEARERIRAALLNSGFQFPKTRVTINLAPADIKKEGSGFDLPIALGILVASNVVSKEQVRRVCAIGELALDGSIRHVHGGLLYGICAREHGCELLLPAKTARQAASIDGIQAIPVESLRDVVLHLKHVRRAKPAIPKSLPADELHPEDDIQFISGQVQAKRALEIAAAGGHNLLFFGPPGTGKTMLARALATLLPKLSRDEQIEVTKIWASSGALPADAPLIGARPFRSPHHSASSVALIGGGSKAKPGEVSLAHNGVLFLDECTEFPAHVLNTLRQPIESGRITVSRAERTIDYPAAFQLIASMNPCPCGNAGSEELLCTCTSQERQKYQKRLSGPLLDRIDMVIRVPRQKLTHLAATERETSQCVQSRVLDARSRQQKRQGKTLNAKLQRKELKAACQLDAECERLVCETVNSLHLSRRSLDSIIRVSRTIADLAGEATITKMHLAESIQFRVAKEDLFSV